MLKTIKIDGIEQGDTQYGKKITFLSGKEKYLFYDTLKAGGFTKAYDQFKRFRFGIGDVVSAEVDEKPKSFTNSEGKTINYTERIVKYFQVIDEIPVVETPKTSVSAPILPQDGFSGGKGINDHSDQILARLTALEGRVRTIEKELYDKRNEGDLPPF